MDIWALGVIFFEMLYGQLPFFGHGKNEEQVKKVIYIKIFVGNSDRSYLSIKNILCVRGMQEFYKIMSHV